MLIKEYRIPMPLSVEEYRIAQLYMIQVKELEEESEWEGCESLFNSKGVAMFSIDIETYYKSDTGNQADVFNLSLAERRQRTLDPIDIVKDPIPPHEYKAEEDPRIYRSIKTSRGPLNDDWIEEFVKDPSKSPVMCAYKLCKVEFRYWGMQSKIERFIHDVGLRKVMVRAHRQAWCWQDEWYGLTMEDIRQLELETQLALAQKMAQYAEEATEANCVGDSFPEKSRETQDTLSPSPGQEVVGVDTLQARGTLTKQWSTSSRSSRSSKRGVSPSQQSISEWRMQSIARDSEDNSDDEFFDAHEDFSDNEEIFPKEIAKWNSNDLMDKIEAGDLEESTELYQEMGEYTRTASEERLDEDELCPESLQSSKIHVLILVLHGGNILDTGCGEQSSKQGDVNTITSAFDTVMHVHYPSALGHVAIRLVPCPPICAEAFSLVSNLSPYSYDEGCLSSSQDHIPLAALPLLATSSPQYQDAVATVISRANQVYSDFLRSLDGASFSGQVCLIGDCVGGILGFDALCSSSQTVCESQSSSRRGSVVSVQDPDLLSPGIIINCSHDTSSLVRELESSRQLSRSNIDIPHFGGPDDSKRQLHRKKSDSSTYEIDTVKQHQAFLSSLHSSVLRHDPGSRRSSNSTMLESGALGKFDFEVTDFFLFGSPLGLVLALRKTVIPMLDVAQLRPACQQVYNLFHPADPSASRLEPLLEKKFHLLPPFNVPRYQRFPLGDGNSALLVETVQSHPELLLESVQRCQEVLSETCISVPVLHSDIVHTHGGVFMESSYPSSPLMAPQCLGPVRRASEVSIASQVSGMADSYTASNIANSKCAQLMPCFLSFSIFSLSLSLSVCLSVSLEPTPLPWILPCPDLLYCFIVAARWWGTKRLDFALYCPDALTAFPTVALPHLFHASYWESTDVVSFLLRQVMRHESSSVLELHGREVSEFTPSRPREKWMRKRTHVKIRNVTANHRVNDAVFTEDAQKVVTGRFMYGPLDMVTLAGEKVDILIMTQPPSGEWEYLHTEVTNSSGRISYTISEQEGKRLGVGVYPIKMVVRGDHTFADSYLTVLPPATEFVVFSIDGSFAASVSIMGSDPKVRAGAVDVVRHWQDLGYVIIYVTGRPDMQKQRVVAWLSQHNFPHGIVSFCDGLVHDPLRHKANFLKSLITEAQMKACAGYGSTKDISVYTSVGLSPSQIYIVGRPSKKMQHQCQFITDGYAAHLSQLEYTQRSRPAKASSTRMVLRKASFGLGANTDFLRKRNHVLRSMSSQPTASSPTSVHMKPERTQSQSDGERMQTERVERGQAQRSMSLAAGCWGRSSTSKLESRSLHHKS
uniref:Phosphatidylinositol transfer protein membrane associated 2 n=1 Tax=Astyanax mexicanus TaxID=7994 RepID=A0A8B9KS85_ASTMX